MDLKFIGPPGRPCFSHTTSLMVYLAVVPILILIPLVILSRDQQTLYRKVQILNILGFTGHLVSIVIPQVCFCRRKAVIDNDKQMDMALF
jgi:hypothetical protein